MSGYFLNSKRDAEGWHETGLDYDLLSYRLTNLSCGSVYSFSLVCHNIAGNTMNSAECFCTSSAHDSNLIHCSGRSKPSASITTPTLGSPPQEISLERSHTTVVIKYFLNGANIFSG